MCTFINVLILIISVYFVGTLAGPAKGGRIINGIAAGRRQFPFIAYLKLHFPKSDSSCGGSLISQNYVVTAAHCVQAATSVEVTLGSWSTTAVDERAHQNIHVPKANIILHPQWDTKMVKNDIALLKLSKPAVLNEYVQPVKLPSRYLAKNSFANRRAIAAGWGLTSDGTLSSHLQYVQQRIIENSECLKSYPGFLEPTNICISTAGSHGTCNGDSGGPLILADGTTMLVGITSFGSYVSCAHGDPAGFTRITSYLDWLKQNTDAKIL